MAWQEIGLYQVEVDQIWREREEITNAVKRVSRKKITLLWRHVRTVEQCSCDDRHCQELNGKAKTTITVKHLGTITILADYTAFRDKWVEFCDTYVVNFFDKHTN